MYKPSIINLFSNITFELFNQFKLKNNKNISFFFDSNSGFIIGIWIYLVIRIGIIVIILIQKAFRKKGKLLKVKRMFLFIFVNKRFCIIEKIDNCPGNKNLYLSIWKKGGIYFSEAVINKLLPILFYFIYLLIKTI